MADRWYYAHDENKIGPFSGQQLRNLADSGHILVTDTVWKEGIGRGVSATKVKNLFLPAHPIASPASAVGKAETSVPTADVKPIPAELAVGTKPDEATVGVATAPDKIAPEPIPDNIELEPEAPVPATPDQVSPQKPKVKKGQAVAVKGAIIVAQDGTNAKYKKKCTTCSHEDTSWHTLRITNAVTRLVFFCPKCRKKRDVEIKCYLR